MRKVAIITLYDSNIGNRLQNYALQRILERHGFDAYTYWYSLKLSYIQKIKRIIKELLGWFHISKYRLYFVEAKRKKGFERFTNKYIKKGKKMDLSRKIRFEDKYEYYITGSDQVWHNWHNFENELEYFYLTFVPETKRIAFSPSIGLDRFPEKDIEMHKYGINGIKALSCREKTGCEMIKDLCGREAELLSDPTLLLDKQEWIEIERKPTYEIDNKYVLLYFLGGIEKYINDAIEKFAAEHNCKVISIFDSDFERQYYTGPDEFIYLIHHAKYIFTDSYHACVFSIIFEKDYLVFPRKELPHEKMATRIDDLFDRFQIGSRWFGDNPQIDICKYENVSTVLKEERKKADNYIEKFMK
nr:polysaccharide pyruvyl transferase family protein [uncultured Acetatifactor sp.]